MFCVCVCVHRWLDKYHVEQLAHRIETLIVFISLIGSLVGMGLSESVNYDVDRYRWMRIFPALCLLRAFVFWKSSLRFLFMIKAALQSLIALFVVMFCVFFTYGVLGVSMFGGINYTSSIQNGDDLDYMLTVNGKANFSTLGHAMITLIQGFVGEAFHEILCTLLCLLHSPKSSHFVLSRTIYTADRKVHIFHISLKQTCFFVVTHF